MKSLLHNIRLILVIFAIVFVSLIAGLVLQENRSKHELSAVAGENKRALASRYAKAGQIESIDGVRLAYSDDSGRQYAEDEGVAASMLQLVGDYTHNISNTIESEYQGFLLGTDRPFLQQLKFDLYGRGLGGDQVTLTLDSRINKRAYELMKDKQGAVVLMNYQTGHILASVSTPTTSPQNVIRYEDIPDGALFNRALLGRYAPGSTFKSVTGIGWLSSPQYDPAYEVDCKGEVPLIVPDGVKEANSKGHGPINMERALQVSCNYFFGDLGVKMGYDQFKKTVQDFGVGQKIQADRLGISRSTFKLPKRDSTLSWMSIGQPVADSQLGISPIEMAMMVGAIANHGEMMAPHIVDHLTAPTGQIYMDAKGQSLRQVCSEEVANSMKELLISAVENGTGKPAAVGELRIGGKTGTAEVAGQEKENALFIGFIDDVNYPYCIAVVCEDQGFGSSVAAPIAHDLFEMVRDLQLNPNN